MNLFLLISGGKNPRTVDLTSVRTVILATVAASMIVFGLLGAGFIAGQNHNNGTHDQDIPAWRMSLQKDRDDIKKIARETKDDINALALRLGQIEARSIRLDALGSRLVDIAGLGSEEFDFTEPPAVGGPVELGGARSIRLPQLLKRFSELEQQIGDREGKFDLLETIMIDRELEKQVSPEGRPVTSGWLSSKYGMRTDPFTGKSSWHAGVDFAGKYGSDVVAVAAGIVTWSGPKSGFGKLVEISHGNGLVTRYGHNSECLVNKGEAVEKGQAIAKMGTSGRSTGPHVHFEVLKHGKAVNPAKYIRNASIR